MKQYKFRTLKELSTVINVNLNNDVARVELTGDSRAAFERWFESDSMPLEHSNWFERDEDRDYEQAVVDSAWEAWQAALSWAFGE